MTKISIIIPVLNESKTIITLLEYLTTQFNPKLISELIVVDGGSNDDSPKIVSDFFNKISNGNNTYQLIESSKGRAIQMNTGAAFATGDILYFLHADSFPPQQFDQLIVNKINKGHKAGCFRMKFDSNHFWLQLAGWFTQFSWRVCRGGDQSLFITRKLFDEIGGYDENYKIYEDNILINELYKRNQFVVINKIITTSSRLYKKNGVWKLQFHFWTIYLKKWFGASAEELYNYYKKHITSS